MNPIEMQQTANAPAIRLNPESGEALFSGACYPENAVAFFEPIFDWFSQYARSGAKRLRLVFRLDYFNTSSSKCLLDLFELLQTMHRDGIEVSAQWYYNEDDEEMAESGREFAEDVDFEVELISE